MARSYLQPGAKIELSDIKHQKENRIWEILSMVGEGSSSVCYEARRESKKGILKCFSPLQSNADYETLCENFLRPYRLLDEVKVQNSKNGLLSNYIPYYEIMCDNSDNGRIYVWTPNDKQGDVFTDYLLEVRNNPTVDADKKCRNIIQTIISVSDCVCLLHSAGLLHLDIKPSNILVSHDSAGEINAGNISLFDIDTVCSIGEQSKSISGTKGFCAPEIAMGNADWRSDIYSIGAMLFNAVVIIDGTGNGLYSGEYYSEIESLVNSSKLLDALDIPEKAAFKSVLCHILKKTLARNANQRYDGCEDLIKELKCAKNYLDMGGNALPAKNAAKSKKNVVIGAAAAIAALVIIGVSSFVVSNKRQEKQLEKARLAAIEAASKTVRESIPTTSPTPTTAPTPTPVVHSYTLVGENVEGYDRAAALAYLDENYETEKENFSYEIMGATIIEGGIKRVGVPYDWGNRRLKRGLVNANHATSFDIELVDGYVTTASGLESGDLVYANCLSCGSFVRYWMVGRADEEGRYALYSASQVTDTEAYDGKQASLIATKCDECPSYEMSYTGIHIFHGDYPLDYAEARTDGKLHTVYSETASEQRFDRAAMLAFAKEHYNDIENNSTLFTSRAIMEGGITAVGEIVYEETLKDVLQDNHYVVKEELFLDHGYVTEEMGYQTGDIFYCYCKSCECVIRYWIVGEADEDGRFALYSNYHADDIDVYDGSKAAIPWSSCENGSGQNVACVGLKFVW